MNDTKVEITVDEKLDSLLDIKSIYLKHQNNQLLDIDYLIKGKILQGNLLISGTCGAGKTVFLQDFIYKKLLSNKNNKALIFDLKKDYRCFLNNIKGNVFTLGERINPLKYNIFSVPYYSYNTELNKKEIIESHFNYLSEAFISAISELRKNDENEQNEIIDFLSNYFISSCSKKTIYSMNEKIENNKNECLNQILNAIEQIKSKNQNNFLANKETIEYLFGQFENIQKLDLYEDFDIEENIIKNSKMISLLDVYVLLFLDFSLNYDSITDLKKNIYICIISFLNSFVKSNILKQSFCYVGEDSLSLQELLLINTENQFIVFEMSGMRSSIDMKKFITYSLSSIFYLNKELVNKKENFIEEYFICYEEFLDMININYKQEIHVETFETIYQKLWEYKSINKNLSIIAISQYIFTYDELEILRENSSHIFMKIEVPKEIDSIIDKITQKKLTEHANVTEMRKFIVEMPQGIGLFQNHLKQLFIIKVKREIVKYYLTDEELKYIINKIESLKYFKKIFKEDSAQYIEVFQTTLYNSSLEIEEIKANIDMFHNTILCNFDDINDKEL